MYSGDFLFWKEISYFDKDACQKRCREMGRKQPCQGSSTFPAPISAPRLRCPSKPGSLARGLQQGGDTGSPSKSIFAPLVAHTSPGTKQRSGTAAPSGGDSPKGHAVGWQVLGEHGPQVAEGCAVRAGRPHLRRDVPSARVLVQIGHFMSHSYLDETHL